MCGTSRNERNLELGGTAAVDFGESYFPIHQLLMYKPGTAHPQQQEYGQSSTPCPHATIVILPRRMSVLAHSPDPTLGVAWVPRQNCLSSLWYCFHHGLDLLVCNGLRHLVRGGRCSSLAVLLVWSEAGVVLFLDVDDKRGSILDQHLLHT